jgi:pimeloyl-ACP methyl ester carboxylesterase
MKKLAAVLASVAMIALGVGTASAATDGKAVDAVAAVGTIDWGRCDDAFLRQFGARCGMLDVPLDYTDPTGAQIQIALSRVKHTVPDDQYQGVVLVNPGGPGGSGLIYSILGALDLTGIPSDVGAAYDWIGFDPRGVGSSEPALTCIPNYFHGDRPPYIPNSQALIDKWLARSEKYADACAAAQPDLIQHMTTADAARDMDQIRQALGQDQINYFGFSYGTYLAMVYDALFPGKIRRAVLDSNVDPRNVWYQANLNQDIAFETNISIWFGWIADHAGAYHLGKSAGAVSKRFYEAQRGLKRHPAGGLVGPAEWTDIFLYAGYYQSTWLSLAKTFSKWVNDHNTKRLVNAFYTWVGPGYDNGYAVYLAVGCTDAPWPQDWATWEADNWATHEVAPFVTWANAWFNAPCLFWDAPSQTPVNITGTTTPFLLIDETLDAATPYEGSLYVRSIFANSVLIAVEGGTTHAGTLFSGNDCTDQPIADYLADGTLPPRQAGSDADVVCQAPPQPTPRAGAARTPVSPQRPLPLPPAKV